MIDGSSDSDKQGDLGPSADVTSNGLDEHLEGGVGFAGVCTPEHQSQIA